MKVLKRFALTLLALSAVLAGYLVWLLLFSEADFSHQGPGILGAMVMFFAQVFAGAGVVLLVTWEAIRWRRRIRKARQGAV